MRRLKTSTSVSRSPINLNKITLESGVAVIEYQPLVVEWDTNMPPNENVHVWRRWQIKKYIEAFPEHKPRHILQWIASHSPNPWPQCTVDAISYAKTRIKKQWPRPSEQVKVSIVNSIVSLDFLPLVVEWDMKMPLDENVHDWRRWQIKKYIDVNPKCKPRHVLQWISGHSPNPWPTCTVDSISYAISKIKQQWSRPPKPENRELSVDNRVMSVEFEPLLLKWDAKRHPNVNVHLWRQLQITKYMEAFPEHKPRHVLHWISKLSPNPISQNRMSINFIS